MRRALLYSRLLLRRQAVQTIRIPRFCSTKPSTSRADRYIQVTPLEHILLRPDTYVGSTVPCEETLCWVFEKNEMLLKPLSYAPALLKIFDEILVNAADNKQRDESMSEIRITVDVSSGEFTVWNDGRGLPVELHPQSGIPVPTFIFGHLMTSSNYDDTDAKTVGGRNGYGAKLCNIYSTKFQVRTASSQNKKLFDQIWTNNMTVANEPLITDYEGMDFTEIRFHPDFSRFGDCTLSEELVSLFKRRAADIAGTLRGVKVVFNGEPIQISSFLEYCQTFSKSDGEILYRHPNKRWEYAIVPSDGTFQNMSFVNNIHTSKGGSHLQLITNQIVDIIRGLIEKKTGKSRIRSQLIRNYLFLFVNSLIENPCFDSQSKDTLTTPTDKFGSSCRVDISAVREWAESSGVLEQIIAEVENKERVVWRCSKRSSSLNLSKLEDANWAGGEKSSECTLIITEGDSAKALAVAGLEVVGRDRYGVFPIRGKLINVSDVDKRKALSNNEIKSLCEVLSLSTSLSYENERERKTLRYGKMMLFTDQDEDGSHIKGLLINFIHHFWPKLVESGFICTFVTPLIKARRGGEIRPFYSQSEFKRWREETRDADKWKIKYYKGLGTSTAAEARDYFSNLDKHLSEFEWKEGDSDSIRMAFERKRVSERKEWIRQRIEEIDLEKPDLIGNAANETRCFREFIDKDFINYSLLDLKRSIPSLVDGLKPSQRKILHTLLRGDLNKEFRVSQLAGAVAQQQAYRHGEDSLIWTIVRLAHSFVGTNNLPLLQAIGQFGTRAEGGADAASARYIYTQLSPIIRSIFPLSDDSQLEYMIEENQIVEPKWFCPIVPLVLINGCEGIGSAWSTQILPHKPSDVIDNVRRIIEGRVPNKMIPWYHGFTNETIPLFGGKFEFRGRAKILPPERKNSATQMIQISELPVGIWTRHYKEKVLYSLRERGIISSINEKHSEKSVLFEVEMRRKDLERDADIQKTLKLISTRSMNNMVLFNDSGRLGKYSSTLQILDEFCEVRKRKYIERREKQSEKYGNQLKRLENQLRFVNSLVDGSLKVLGRSASEIESSLREQGFDPDLSKEDSGDFGYLLRMNMSAMTREHVLRLESDCERIREEERRLERQTVSDIWNRELDVLETAIERQNSKRL